jgi:hypothetical protein
MPKTTRKSLGPALNIVSDTRKKKHTVVDQVNAAEALFSLSRFSSNTPSRKKAAKRGAATVGRKKKSDSKISKKAAGKGRNKITSTLPVTASGGQRPKSGYIRKHAVPPKHLQPEVLRRLIEKSLTTPQHANDVVLPKKAGTPEKKTPKGASLQKRIEKISEQLEASGKFANYQVALKDPTTKNIGRASDSPSKRKRATAAQAAGSSASPSKKQKQVALSPARPPPARASTTTPSTSKKNIATKKKTASKKSRGQRGVGKKSSNFLPFKEARTIVRALKLRGARAWWCWSKEYRPSNIPSTPDVTYRDMGWKGMQDWLGTDTISTKANNRNFLPFEKARAFVRKQKLKGKKDWREWSRLKRPATIPSTPQRTYSEQGWIGMADWLGTDGRSTRARSANFLSFEAAKKYVQKFNLKTKRHWDLWSKTKRPSNIPSTPQVTYANQGWKGIPDFLGSDRSKGRGGGKKKKTVPKPSPSSPKKAKVEPQEARL